MTILSDYMKKNLNTNMNKCISHKLDLKFVFILEKLKEKSLTKGSGYMD